MVRKKLSDKSILGGVPERSRFYNIAFPASGVSDGPGETWPFASIRRGLERRCRDVKEIRANGENRRALVATDKNTELRFLALMTHVNNRREDIESMLYACVLSGLGMTDDRAKEIDRHLRITLAYADEGDLYLVASPNILGDFDPDFFDSQLLVYLDELATVIRLLLDDGTHRSAAAAALRSLMAGSDPELGALKNPLGAGRFQVRQQASMFGARHDCEACNGKGKRMFRACAECDGRGYRR